MAQFLPRRGLPLIVADNQKVRWTPRLLTTMAVLVSWQSAGTSREAFEAARAVLVSMYSTRRRPGSTLAGFAQALAGQSRGLLRLVVAELRQHTQALAGRRWRWRDWVVMAADGSRIDCPRTRANRRGLPCAGKDKSHPQLMLTTFWHVASGLLWDWRRGPGRTSERTLLRRMLGDLLRKTLLLLDAGFTGHELLSDVLARGHDVIIRVGRNVRLLTKLGYAVTEDGDTVYLWPEKLRHIVPPLVLRRVWVSKGRRRMCLLTSVRDRRRLSDAEVAAWYRRRWCIETSYRSLKQTMAKRKMLGRKPSHARMELDWAMVGLWMVGLLAGTRQSRRQLGNWSPAAALHTVRHAMRRAEHRPAGRALDRQLQRAVLDSYPRRGRKTAWNWPHRKREPLCGLPRIRMATAREIQAAQALTIHDAAG
jgi:hypothetical protein